MSKEIHNIIEDISVEVMSHAGYLANINSNKKANFKYIPVERLKGLPESIKNGEGSYIMPIWNGDEVFHFDFRMNDNVQNLAFLPSIKGINPITGLPLESIGLEQYRDKCPKHDIYLGHDNYCDECGYNIPYQNYLSQEDARLYGFVTTDGKAREFKFSLDDAKDVAQKLMNGEQSVGIGIVIYKSKNKRDIKSKPFDYNSMAHRIKKHIIENQEHIYTQPAIYREPAVKWFHPYGIANDFYCGGGGGYTSTKYPDGSVVTTCSTGCMGGGNLGGGIGGGAVYSVALPDRENLSHEVVNCYNIQDVSITAGRETEQKMETDLEPLESWHENPASIMRVYPMLMSDLVNLIEENGYNNPKQKSQAYLEDLFD